MDVLKGVGKLEGLDSKFIYSSDPGYNIRVLKEILNLVKERGIQTFEETLMKGVKRKNPLTPGEQIFKFATNELPILATMTYGLETLGVVLGTMTIEGLCEKI